MLEQPIGIHRRSGRQHVAARAVTTRSTPVFRNRAAPILHFVPAKVFPKKSRALLYTRGMVAVHFRRDMRVSDAPAKK
jgi:hypothetical protein